MDEVLPIENESNQDLHLLWKELPGMQRSFLSSNSHKDLETYRQTIIQIARLTLKQNVQSKKIYKKNLQGDTIELRTISFINKHLQIMANTMHSPQNSAFTLLKAMDEIRGILLNIHR